MLRRVGASQAVLAQMYRTGTLLNQYGDWQHSQRRWASNSNSNNNSNNSSIVGANSTKAPANNSNSSTNNNNNNNNNNNIKSNAASHNATGKGTITNILDYPYDVIDTLPKLQKATRALESSVRFSVDIEAYCTSQEQKQLGTISLIQMCSTVEPVVYLVDVVTLGVPTVLQYITPVMTNDKIQKLLFDCRRDVEAMSYQMKLKPKAVLDLQLFYTAIQWRTKSVNRRSGMSYVIKSMCGITRQEGDSAVQAAMTLGNRPVWDVRPLPPHFLEYAAGDVRHILLLSEKLVAQYPEYTDRVERLTGQYVDHYAVEKPVEIEADPKPHDVSVDWLERFIGPGGKCSYCGAKGHTDAECFKRQSNVIKCTHCGEMGHIAKNCFKKFPQLLKCEKCGQMGHTGAKCFQRNRCKHCGGMHSSDNCHQHAKQLRKAEAEAEAKKKSEASTTEGTSATSTSATATTSTSQGTTTAAAATTGTATAATNTATVNTSATTAATSAPPPKPEQVQQQ